MGTAGCKSSKSILPNQQKDDNKNITIGIFGLDDAGKTSTVKAIEGDPTDNVVPTINSISTMVSNPLNDRINKNKKQQRIKIIDVSGERKFRQKSWSQYYDQIHGLIFVIDASEKKRLRENQETLEDLLENDKLKNKPILILANKQDQKGAVSNEHDLKRQLDIEKLKTKHKIELCTALPRHHKNKVDESIRKGFSWLIRAIDDNYTELNSRVTKAKNISMNRKTYRSDSDENDNENKYSKEKNNNYQSKITSQKLPSININKSKTKDYSDDDDIYSTSKNDFNKKKKVLGGGTTSNDKSIKRSGDNEPKPFRATYESFPEETPWSSSSMLKSTKSDDTLSRLYAKPPLSNDTKRRDMSPLVHDTKSYTNGSLSKRHNNNSDDEDVFNRQQKSKSTSRFDNSSFSTNRLSSNTKKLTSSIYDDDNDDYNNSNNRRITTTPKKPYNRDDDNDDDENNYLKKSTTTKSNKNYDNNDNTNYQRSSNRSNLNSEYRGALSKQTTHSKYDDDDDDYSTSKPITRSTYNNDYSTSKSTNRSKYNDDDDDDHRWSSSKSAGRSKYDDDDDDYYPSSSSKAVTHSKHNDDDDDDDYYQSSSKKTNYPSSYGSVASRSRVDNDDFFTKGGTNTTNRFRKNTEYDN